ncbi:hypothetical protein [Streptomyces sp. TRM64462]|uniref:hypothetical protein n=1 Tax=Streptomyces sp. TRM64462 TaxID=2741726 RepID=UPI001586ABF8|nr:hypothetical protein [Streptomyces sp. TRM64462]
MARKLGQVDRDLAKLEDDFKDHVTPAISSLTDTSSRHSEKLRTHSTDIEGLRTTFKALRTTQSGISNTFAGISNTVAGLTGGLTGLALSLTALTVGISVFKVDEKGITILGATREFGWKKKIDTLQKKIESAAQKEDREKKEKRDKLVDDNHDYIKNLKDTQRDVDRIKSVLRTAGQSMQSQRDAEARRPGPTPRGVDTTNPLGPTARGVAAEVRVLRSAVNELATAFA